MDSASATTGKCGTERYWQVRFAALRYAARGWSVIPVPYQSKRPNIKGWGQVRLEPDQINQHFNGGPQNVAVLLGEPSGGLIDIDLDHPRAIELAKQFLPPTPAVFGHKSKPRSHWLYRVTTPVVTKKFHSKSAGMIVELRSTGTLTIFPPSTHTSGESIDWEVEDAEPASIAPDELLNAVEQLANAVLSELPGEPRSPTKRPTERVKRNHVTSRAAPTDAAQRCLAAMLRIQIADHQDGSHRLFACACRAVEHDLDDSTALATIRAYASQHPFPKNWTVAGILQRIRDAEKRCTRGAALEVDGQGMVPLGWHDPGTGRLVLSPKRTLPTAQAYIRTFHLHVEGRTLHSYAGRLLEWQDNHYVEVEEDVVKQRLQEWLHDALRYAGNRNNGKPILVPFDSNPTTIKAAFESIRTLTCLPAAVTPPLWLREGPSDPLPQELLACNLLAERTQASLSPLHVPGEHEHHPVITELNRPTIGPQGDVISAMAKALGRQKAVFFAGEMGTGKTIGGMAAVHCHANGGPYRALVWCPGHLLKKWKREILDTIPGARVTLLQTCADVFALWDDRHAEPDRPEWYVIARDRAKLGAKWQAAVVERPKIVEDEGKRKRATALYCSACGKSLIDKDGVLLSLAQLERKRSYCENVVDKEKDARCGAPLWQYVHYAGRFEPAMWIKRRLKGFFRYLIIDEAHEEKGADTAQGNAVGLLVAACDKVIALTGTLIGGFAEHLRPLLFRLAPGTLVDEGLSWKDQTKFVERYGRIETRISTTASESRGGWEDNAQSRGSRRSTTKICRPGIMPTLFGRHLIGNALFLSLEPACGGSNTLPTLTETVTPVAMDPVLAGNYERLEETLRAEIKALFRAKGPGGCRLILSQMLNALLLYPDHPFGWNEIGYHDNGAWVPVCKPLGLDPNKVWAKEKQLIRLVKNEHWNGRQTWVFTTYNGEKDVQGRIAKLLAQAEPGLVVKELRANVPLAQREEWIAKEGRDAHVIVSHPKLVETGLDLFDKAGRHNFSTLIFYETGYNLFTLRQASRRSWRIGQPLPCKVMYLYYDGTMQAQALAHMGNKLAASLALDGKFSSDGLAAMCDDDSMEMVMAKSLVDNITEDAQGAWEHAKDRERDEPVLLSFEHYKAQLAAGEDGAINDLLALFGTVEARVEAT